MRVENDVEYGDDLKYLNYAFMGDVARDNAEVLRELALAPAAPTRGKTFRWRQSRCQNFLGAPDDSERAGFEILWRETTEPRWQVYDFVAAPGEITLNGVSTDNHFFAVRSVGKNGARSVATSTGASRANAYKFSPPK